MDAFIVLDNTTPVLVTNKHRLAQEAAEKYAEDTYGMTAIIEAMNATLPDGINGVWNADHDVFTVTKTYTKPDGLFLAGSQRTKPVATIAVKPVGVDWDDDDEDDDEDDESFEE